MKILFSVLLSFCLLIPASHAADAEGNYAVWGAGKKSCFKYNKARAAKEDAVFINYTKGFITAYNILIDNTYSLTGMMTIDEIMAWMDDYCETKQTSGYENALLVFIADHEESRMRRPKQGIGR